MIEMLKTSACLNDLKTRERTVDANLAQFIALSFAIF